MPLHQRLPTPLMSRYLCADRSTRCRLRRIPTPCTDMERPLCIGRSVIAVVTQV
ncbi:unnamed protein product [Haemonchus placei]|uniref:Uncharacterized protein n=1 Tax=Haemonchus placei TaxID=6290 RepID=A0A0N4W7C4_HAEPC|nr:unnamed protein product [Haemonchus placei]